MYVDVLSRRVSISPCRRYRDVTAAPVLDRFALRLDRVVFVCLLVFFPTYQMEAADLEWYLASQGIVETELEENPARGRGANTIKMRRGVGRSSRAADDNDYDDDS